MFPKFIYFLFYYSIALRYVPHFVTVPYYLLGLLFFCSCFSFVQKLLANVFVRWAVPSHGK